MRVLGIDPGKTIGLCVYDTALRKVLDAVQVHTVAEAHREITRMAFVDQFKMYAIERPRIYSKGGGEIADTLEQFGALWVVCTRFAAAMPSEWLPRVPGAYRVTAGPTPVWAVERRAVLGELSAQLGAQVKGDAGVWTALCDLHGGKGIAEQRQTKQHPAGPLGALSGLPHARAALAVAYVAGALEAK